MFVMLRPQYKTLCIFHEKEKRKILQWPNFLSCHLFGSQNIWTLHHAERKMFLMLQRPMKTGWR